MHCANRRIGRREINANAHDLWQLPNGIGSDHDRWSGCGPCRPREIIALRRNTLGYVSQFLRVVPRVSTLDVVSEPLLTTGTPCTQALETAQELLARLNISERLWSLSPTTFSGGEQQRVNIARGFAYPYPALLLDEPTASLDPKNRAIVLAMITEAKARGAAIIGIFHDAAARDEVCDRQLDVGQFTPGTMV